MTNIFKDGLLAYVHVCYCTFQMSLTAEDLGLKEEDIADAFSLGRKMLVPADVMREFRAVEGRARRVVDENSFQFPISNARFITRRKFPKVLEALKKCQGEYMALVNKLVVNYDKHKTEMLTVYRQAAEIAYGRQPAKTEFGPEFDPERDKQEFVSQFLTRVNALYPAIESLPGRFSLDWDVYEIALPRMRQADSGAIVENEKMAQIATEEYQLQMQKKIGGFIDNVVTTLRHETMELCSRISNNIKDGKVVKSTTLNSLGRFVEKFRELNFVGDQKVEAQLELLQKEFLDVHSNEQITEQVDLQDELKRRLNLLIDSASDMTDVNSITGEYKRKIEWQDTTPVYGANTNATTV